MSTANGHGLAEPKRRGKPVGHANKGASPARGAHCRPVSKGNPVNIPEPEGWTEQLGPVFSAVAVLRKRRGCGGGAGIRGAHKAATLNRPLGRCP